MVLYRRNHNSSAEFGLGDAVAFGLAEDKVTNDGSSLEGMEDRLGYPLSLASIRGALPELLRGSSMLGGLMVAVGKWDSGHEDNRTRNQKKQQGLHLVSAKAAHLFLHSSSHIYYPLHPCTLRTLLETIP